jgi:hypothetical protein
MSLFQSCLDLQEEGWQACEAACSEDFERVEEEIAGVTRRVEAGGLEEDCVRRCCDQGVDELWKCVPLSHKFSVRWSDYFVAAW